MLLWFSNNVCSFYVLSVIYVFERFMYGEMFPNVTPKDFTKTILGILNRIIKSCLVYSIIATSSKNTNKIILKFKKRCRQLTFVTSKCVNITMLHCSPPFTIEWKAIIL